VTGGGPDGGCGAAAGAQTRGTSALRSRNTNSDDRSDSGRYV